MVNKLNLPQSLWRVINRYSYAFNPERILLFGSYAKGGNNNRSDIDLLIVLSTDTDDFSNYLKRARQLAADSFPRIDPIFVSTEEVKNVTLISNAFLLSALESGLVLYPER